MDIPLSIPHLDVGLGCLGSLPPTCGPWEAQGQGDTTDRQVCRDPEDRQQQDPPCPRWAPFCPHFQCALCSVWFRKGARETYAESCEESPFSSVPSGGGGCRSLGGQQERQPGFSDQDIQVLGRLEELGRGADKHRLFPCGTLMADPGSLQLCSCHISLISSPGTAFDFL